MLCPSYGIIFQSSANLNWIFHITQKGPTTSQLFMRPLLKVCYCYIHSWWWRRRKLYYCPCLRPGVRIGMRLLVSYEICVLVGSLWFQCIVHYTGWLALLCWMFNPLHPLLSLLLQWVKPTIECPTAPQWPPPISTTSSRPGIGYCLSWLWISSVSLISACTGY